MKYSNTYIDNTDIKSAFFWLLILITFGITGYIIDILNGLPVRRIIFKLIPLTYLWAGYLSSIIKNRKSYNFN